MTQEIAVKEAPSIIQDMATRFGMDKRAFEATLKATVVPANVSNEQFVAFLLVAKQYNLNPITKEIYAFPAKGGGIQPIVGIDGWCNIINSNPQLDGIEFEDVMTDGKLTAITCKIYRKDRSKPTEATEYMDECKRSSDPWTKWPARMLRHKALIQCARYAFSFSGIVDPDEAERMIDVTPENKAPFASGTFSMTNGEITTKQAYGSAANMGRVWKKIIEEINNCTTEEELDLVVKKYAADFDLSARIDPQFKIGNDGLIERRRQSIKNTLTDVPVEDGGLTPEEMVEWEQERAKMNDVMGLPVGVQ